MIVIMMIIIIMIIMMMMIMMMMMIIKIKTVIITLKGAIQKFLQSPYCTVNYLPQVHSSDPGTIVYKSHAKLQALITCSMSCAT